MLSLALMSLLLLSGGTAQAAFVVSSNSQIGPDTVSGHRPPTGKHSNLIPSSVSATDLAPGAVTAPKLGANSVNGLKVRNGSIGTLDLAARVRLPQGCASSQVAKATASHTWVCGNTTPTGTAGGALSGTYPNPDLDVSGGPCANGRALTNVSAAAVLTCAPGVYSDGSGNVAAGPSAFPALTTGTVNTAMGDQALGADTNGVANTAVGQAALSANTTGVANSGFGHLALEDNLNGNFNSALGDAALANNTDGSSDSAVGVGALNLNVHGANNSAIGNNALGTNFAGNNNSAVGQNSLSNAEGNRNVAIGRNAGTTLTTGDDNIYISNNGPGFTAESNSIHIGTQGTQTATFLAGVSGTTTGGTASPVLVDANGQLGTTSSSRRVKTDIRPLRSERRRLMRLRPVSFRYREQARAHGAAPLQYGLIAEQVARVYPNLVVNGDDGRPNAVAYQELPALLLAQNQAQQRRIVKLERQVRRLTATGR